MQWPQQLDTVVGVHGSASNPLWDSYYRHCTHTHTHMHTQTHVYTHAHTHTHTHTYTHTHMYTHTHVHTHAHTHKHVHAHTHTHTHTHTHGELMMLWYQCYHCWCCTLMISCISMRAAAITPGSGSLREALNSACRWETVVGEMSWKWCIANSAFLRTSSLCEQWSWYYHHQISTDHKLSQLINYNHNWSQSINWSLSINH